jgi:hypothetical protein
VQHLRHDIDLLAFENVVQSLALDPCSGSRLGDELTDEAFKYSLRRLMPLLAC